MHALRLVPDRTSLCGDGYDAEPVILDVVDAAGRMVPTADVEATFTSNGPGSIIGLNNGDPTKHESEKGRQHSTYQGLSQVIVQINPDRTGSYTLRAAGDQSRPALLWNDASS